MLQNLFNLLQLPALTSSLVNMRSFVLVLTGFSISCMKTFAADSLFGDLSLTENPFASSDILDPNNINDVSTTEDFSTTPTFDDWSDTEDLSVAFNDLVAPTEPDSDFTLAGGCGNGQGINKLRSRDEPAFCSNRGTSSLDGFKFPASIEELGLRDAFPLPGENPDTEMCLPPFVWHVCCNGGPPDITQPGIFRNIIAKLTICYWSTSCIIDETSFAIADDLADTPPVPCLTVYEACCLRWEVGFQRASRLFGLVTR